jgi:aminoglycoside phosphotransferase (APT) family kinase protein
MTSSDPNQDVGQGLENWLSTETGREVSVGPLTRLVGGNSREIYQFDLDGRSLVIRLDPVGATSRFTPGVRLAEFRAMKVAHEHGVPAPEVLWVSEDSGIVGAPFIIMEYVAGESIPRRILRDEALAAVRPSLARQCGEILARLHAVPPPEGIQPRATGALPVNIDELNGSKLDDLARVCGRYPALEFVAHWLLTHVPQLGRMTLVHGDFRNGNLIIGPEGIKGVVDWESVHVGDPLEDLAWLCVRSWRFGNDELHAGGFGTRDQLIEAYEDAGGVVDRARLRWWEILATYRWGVGCVMNAEYYLSGASKNIEMAALGRRVAEMEYDLLELIHGRDI